MIYGGAYEILIRASKEATLSKAGKHERGLYLLTTHIDTFSFNPSSYFFRKVTLEVFQAA
ncbi:hypothetical protein Hanom_Chr01g00055251 [Helianthus anomalus]